MLNRLDPDQAGHFVGPDLGPNCLERLSEEATLSEVKWLDSWYSGRLWDRLRLNGVTVCCVLGQDNLSAN